MKNIFAIMKEYGIEVPEDKQKEFEKSVLENYKTVADYDKQKDKLDQANETITANDTAMKDLKAKIDEFKDVDVTALNTRIKELEEEKGNIESDYQAKLADRDFNDILKDSISAANGRNSKAIAALLDIDTLKTSKNQKDDIAAAIKALTEAEDSKMLFGEPDAKPIGTGNTIGSIGARANVDVDTTKMRSIMGLPPETKGE